MKLAAHVDREETLRYLGHGGQRLDPELEAQLKAAISLCETTCCARGIFLVFDVERIDTREGVWLDGSLFLPGADIARHLAGSCRVVLLASTLGAESERLLRQRLALSPTEGVLVDASLSSMAESAIEFLHEQVRLQAEAMGLRAGDRFSPGYGDLPLTIQGPFLRALGADKQLGMRVTDSDMLAPTKSVTAVVGLYEPYEEDEPIDEPSSRPRGCHLADVCVRLKRGGTCNGCQL